MAQISFKECGTWESAGYENEVTLFSLKNDGDSALVRIMHDTTSSFDIQTVHDVKKADGKTNRVSCLRSTPSEPLDNCPLCRSGNATKTRLFIHMLLYVDGTTKSVIWERSATGRNNYAMKLAEMIKEYGPLSNCLFKIVRHGAAGSMETTYDILYAPPTTYPDDQYPRPEDNPFEGVKIPYLMDKTAEEMEQFIVTGSFPRKESIESTTLPATQFSQPVQNTPPAYNDVSEFNPQQYQSPQQQYYQQPQSPTPYGVNLYEPAPQEGFARPQRY